MFWLFQYASLEIRVHAKFRSQCKSQLTFRHTRREDLAWPKCRRRTWNGTPKENDFYKYLYASNSVWNIFCWPSGVVEWLSFIENISLDGSWENEMARVFSYNRKLRSFLYVSAVRTCPLVCTVVEEVAAPRSEVSLTLRQRVEGKGEANSWHRCSGSTTTDLYTRALGKHTD